VTDRLNTRIRGKKTLTDTIKIVYGV